MQVTRNSIETMTGPSEWFTGAVYVDSVAAPSGPSQLSTSSVHFTPAPRTAWHKHPNGQTIYVTEGVGLAQRRGEPIEVIRPGAPRSIEAVDRPIRLSPRRPPPRSRSRWHPSPRGRVLTGMVRPKPVTASG
jgi:hypothetical protein